MIPALLSFGPLFMVIGLSMGGNYVIAIVGSMMISLGSMTLFRKIKRLEKKINELNKE